MSDSTSTSEGIFDLKDFILGPVAGAYGLHLEHTLRSKASVAWTSSVDLSVNLSAPKLRLPDGAIHSCHPTPASDSGTAEHLPFLVLNNPGLPWIHLLNPAEAAKSPTAPAPARRTPWMALLVLHPDERDKATLSEIPLTELKAKVGSVWTAEALAALPEADRKGPVRTLKLSNALFAQITPQRDELAGLAHLRVVRAQDKADGGGSELVTAVVLANRLPAQGENQAVLVSLDGLLERLPTEKTPAAGDIHLLVLHAWTFTARAKSATFAGRVEALAPTPLRLHVDASPGDAAIDALRNGQTPVILRSHGANPDFVWYRGPLAPVEVPPFAPRSSTFASADEALIVDPDTGMVDISYAAAWQLGRTLALASAGFTEALQRWSSAQLERQIQEEEALTARGLSIATVDVHTLMEDLARSVELGDARAKQAQLLTIAEWLADLALLRLVPLSYLIPSPRLLPRESLRIFHVDPRWVDALVDGAVSVGSPSLSLPASLRAERGPMRRALRLLVEQLSARRRGRAPVTDRSALSAEIPLAGLLLRSSVLNDYPGAELVIREGDRKLPLLRMELIAEGVLFAVVEGRPTGVLFREPREGLRFGPHEGKIAPRKEDGTPRGGKALALADHLRPVGSEQGSAKSVLNIQSLMGALATAEQPAGSSASLALNLLKPPEDIEFQWTRS